MSFDCASNFFNTDVVPSRGLEGAAALAAMVVEDVSNGYTRGGYA